MIERTVDCLIQIALKKVNGISTNPTSFSVYEKNIVVSSTI